MVAPVPQPILTRDPGSLAVAQSSRLGLKSALTARETELRVSSMAKTNGRFTEKTVSEWFSVMDFQAQRNMLEKLNEAHDKVRQVRINALKRELLMLENGSSNGHIEKPAKRAKKKARVAVKYRDPKSGGTWSGRGRMASWLAEKVKAGEKVEKYLA